jgi:hypothetical protein
MSGKTGKDSGVVAEDVAKAPDIGRVEPGKSNRVSNEVGDAWIDHGAACDGKDASAPGCFLTDWQRLRLIVDIKSRIETASTNYKIALTELRIAEMLKKDDDLPWVLALALDLVGSHLIKILGRAAVSLKSAGLGKLSAAMDGVYLEDRSWQSRTQAALGALDDRAIETHVKATFDPVKKAGVGAVKSSLNATEHEEKNQTIAYIDQLKDQCDVGFQTFAETMSARAVDAELVVLREGLDRANHSISAYKAALAEKLERFRASGVTEVGRQLAIVDRFPHGTRVRDKRVVWFQEDGKKTLRYQSQQSAFLTQSMEGHEFGPRYAEAAQLGPPVPDEFAEVALARSEQVWGPTPLVIGKSAAPPRTTPTHVPTHVPARPVAVEPNVDALPDAFRQVKA